MRIGDGMRRMPPYLESQLLSLDSSGTPGLVTGGAGGEIVLVDADHDLETERVPSVSTTAAWGNGGTPLTAPITGDGRRAASACRSDAECGAHVCAPIASYLKVRQIERDCRRPVGVARGAVGCALDADCASGLCFDPGSGVCYGACDGNACALGTCQADVAQLSLDPVLMGLGNGSTSACVP